MRFAVLISTPARRGPGRADHRGHRRRLGSVIPSTSMPYGSSGWVRLYAGAQPRPSGGAGGLDRHQPQPGRGPAFIKLGSRVAYRGSDLNAWLATRSVRPTDGDGG